MKISYSDNCWILISPKKADHQYESSFPQVDYIFSFLYDAGEWAAEWEPRYGPIQIWNKCEEGAENAQEHYFYNWENTSSLSWSQLSVEKEQLPQMFLESNWDAIFNVLRDWARDR